MKNVDKSKVCVYWRTNKKAWVTVKLFNDWFYNCIVSDVTNYTKKQKIGFNLFLLLDNVTGHPKN